MRRKKPKRYFANTIFPTGAGAACTEAAVDPAEGVAWQSVRARPRAVRATAERQLQKCDFIWSIPLPVPYLCSRCVAVFAMRQE